MKVFDSKSAIKAVYNITLCLKRSIKKHLIKVKDIFD